MILITGSNGFLGTHCFNYLKYILNITNVEKLPREAFYDDKLLDTFLTRAEKIIHFAGVNRNENENFIYEKNIELSEKLIASLNRLKRFPRFINISSIHEYGNSHFGKSKKKSRKLFEEYYNYEKERLISFIAPNIFGPFCEPNYNSFVATFCNSIINEKDLKINQDVTINLLYVNDFIIQVASHLESKYGGVIKDFETEGIKISTVLRKLIEFKEVYVDKLEFPEFQSDFDINLFNTFRSYLGENFFPKQQTKHNDERGYFSELVRSKSECQVSISVTNNSVERGNHFHTHKIERFQVLKGKAIVQVRKVNSNKIKTYLLNGKNLEFIDIPIWHTHNLINNSENEDLVMLFWISKHYDKSNHDTYPLKVTL